MRCSCKNRSAFLLLAAALLGCGGGGNDSASVPAGRYVGSWTSENPEDETGTADLTIASDRTISGTMNADYGPGYGPGGEPKGEIESNGKANIVGLWYETGNPVPLALDYQGTLRYDAATGTLRGVLSRDRGDGISRHSWTLTRQP